MKLHAGIAWRSSAPAFRRPRNFRHGAHYSNRLPDIPDRATTCQATALIRRRTGHSLDEAAQLIEDALGRSQFVRAMAGLLAAPKLTIQMKHRLRWLQGIPFRLILT